MKQPQSVVMGNGQVAVLQPTTYGPKLKIYEEDGIDEGAYSPAKSMSVWAVYELQKFLNDNLPPKGTVVQ